MRCLRVGLAARRDLLSRPGGDTSQIRRLVEELRYCGVHSELLLEPPRAARHDLLHLFNLTRVHDTWAHARAAVRGGRPFVLTPIYHSLRDYNRHGRLGLARLAFRLGGGDEGFEYLRNIYRMVQEPRDIPALLRQYRDGYRRQQRWLLQLCTRLLPNSRRELEAIREDLFLDPPPERVRVIPVGIDDSLVQADPEPFRRRYGLQDFVLCVSRFEALKNQLTLVRALAHSRLPLVLIGSVRPNHRGYLRRLLRAGRSNPRLTILRDLPRRLVESAFGAARVHVLVSWVETTGLVSLEAGLAGCNVVVSRTCYAAAELAPLVRLCAPDDLEEIRGQVEAAYEEEPNPALREEILRHFDWKRVARATVEVYETVR
jgi:glycosyltransferase involved in cell wall biosynthesis